MPRPHRANRVSDRRDLVVIGGGTAGLVSALIAAGAGARVTLVERERTGGDCLWTGCVPSKSLLAAADLAHQIRHADRVGLSASEPEIDFAAVMAHVNRAQELIAPQDSVARLEHEGVEVIRGHARLQSPGIVAVEDLRLRYRKALIATGSRPRLPPIPGLAEAEPLTSDTVWQLQDRPTALAVLGGGAIGCELAQGFARLGSEVTLIEQEERLLAREEPRAGALLAAQLRAEGIHVRCSARVASVAPGLLHCSGGPHIAFDQLLVAAGRRPVSDDLGLEQAGVQVNENGAIKVDARLRTTAPHVYAAGDVTAVMPFTHVAAYHARVATVNALFGARRTVDYAAVPRVVFTDPEIASVGLTEAQARSRWPRPLIQSFDYDGLDRAITDGRRVGFVTLAGDPKGRLIGATIAAPRAAESIAELAAWVASGAKMERISQTVHAYPTFSEGPARAADELLRARFAAPRVRRATGLALQILRLIDRPR